ncbi:flavocytochrome c [uncultured Sutterella sp.]|uniref:FAD-dependent oxidoreductase n=1 Tax=uncultured Sutterella sp. TaxID=286133 RepID=UPI00262CA54F|nr:flavocytochrome c [uncultured Sutterella sp.]
MKFKLLTGAVLMAAAAAVMAEGFDVVVVGSGGAGLSSAILAKENGASVVVLEKMPYLGGNTNFASGGMNAAGTKQQLAAGVTNDSPKIFYDDTMKGGHNLNNPALLKTLTENARYSEEWLVDLGANFCFRKGRGGGQSIARGHGPCDGSAVGPEVLRVLLKKANADKIDIRKNNQVVDIVMKDGKVAGVKVKTPKGEETIDAKAVILATGGFGANLDLVAHYRPELKGFSTTNQPGAQGEGLKLAEKAGAAFTDIDQIQIHPTVIKRDGHLISESMRARGAILVNQEGKRFTNELLTRDVVSQNELKQPGQQVYLIYDQSIFDSNKLSRGYFEHGYSVKADSVADLAKKINVPVANLEATFKDYWNAYKTGKDTAFGRPEMVIPLDKAPFYAAKVTPGIHHTMGGVTINPKTEVQSKDGKSIPGLFAAGEVTGGVHGGNRIGGNAVADIVTFGRIAGQNAAAYAESH